MGRSRAVRPSVSEAKVKRHAMAIISRLQCKFSKIQQNMHGETQSHKGKKKADKRKGAGERGKGRNEEEDHQEKALDRRRKGERSLGKFPLTGGE